MLADIAIRNHRILKKRFPSIYKSFPKSDSEQPLTYNPVISRNKFINFTVGQPNEVRTLCYREDYISKFLENMPEKLQLETYDILFFVGLGLGYLPLAAIEYLSSMPRIVIIEPSMSLFRFALGLMDMSSIIEYKRLDLYVGSNIEIPRVIDQYYSIIPIGKNQILCDPASRIVVGERFLEIKQELEERIGTIRDNWYTAKKFGKKIIGNTLSNLSSLIETVSMKSLKKEFKDVPAVCVAAGPSLDNNLKSLIKIQNNALIIACDSSVNSLLKVGIKPHFVVTTDIFKTNFAKVRSHFDQMRESILIFGIESNPDNVRKFLGPKRVAVSSSSRILLDWLDPKWNLNCRLPFLTSVSQMAIFSALDLGADPIVLVGMDLSYPKGSSHSAGSVIQESINMKKLVKIRGVNGNNIFSSPQLVADKIFLEGEIEKSEPRFINTSLDGALIKGTEIKSLNEILNTDIKSDVDVNRLLSGIDWTSSISGTEAVAELNEMLQKVIDFKDVCDDNEKLINDSIAKGNFEESKEQIAERFKDIKRDFENFKHKNSLILGIIELAIGKEIHEILKKRECIEAKDYKDQNRKIWDETDLIRYHYRAYSKGADFFYNRLNKTTIDFEKAQFLKHTGSVDNIRDQWNKHQKIGRHYAKIEEIWQAEREYLNAIQIRPEDPSSWLELAQMFANAELWPSARDYIENACRLFPNDSEIMDLKAEIEDKINGIMDQIKDAWVAGDKETTRRLLNGYLLLCPDDEQANLLKGVLQELDETLAADSPVVQQQKNNDLQFDELLANAALCIEKLKFEQAIGIIEGLIETFPQKKAVLREKIGDIRMLQQDYPSAVWNYDQVLKFVDKNFEIKAKLNRAKQELEYLKNDCTHREIYVQKSSCS